VVDACGGAGEWGVGARGAARGVQVSTRRRPRVANQHRIDPAQTITAPCQKARDSEDPSRAAAMAAE
jgi:hypothetical protein